MKKSIAFIFVALVAHISARAFPAPAHTVIVLLSPVDSHADLIHSDYPISSEHDALSNSRQRRASYSPYSDYGNYNNYYEEERPRRRPARPHRRQHFDGDQGLPRPSSGTKYAYQPLFKYKATHQKKHKLFVPNIFG